MRRKICLIFLISILFCNNTLAKYKINYEINCFEIISDTEPPSFEVKYSSISWTNKNVVISVKPSEEVDGIDGFEFENGLYKRVVKENEEKEIPVSDLYGNQGVLRYSVNNIDKEPPVIKNIKNNEKYDEPIEVEYIDEGSGIKQIDKCFYGDLLIDCNFNYVSNLISINVIRMPKNIVSYKYYRVDNLTENYINSNQTSLQFNMQKSKNCSFYVIAVDNNGNMFKSNIVTAKSSYLEDYHINESKNIFSKNGYYDIKVYDNAGNKSDYIICIEK